VESLRRAREGTLEKSRRDDLTVGPIHRKPRTAAELSPEELEHYRQMARERLTRKREALAKRRERAWEVARRVAAILKERFGASGVWVCGSLLRRGFGPTSDVDLVVEGLSPDTFTQALRAVEELNAEIDIDLMRWEEETLPLSLRRMVKREGVEL